MAKIVVQARDTILATDRLRSELGDDVAFLVLKKLEPVLPKFAGWFQVDAEAVDELSEACGDRPVEPVDGCLQIGREMRLQSILMSSGFYVRSEDMWDAWEKWCDAREEFSR